MKVYKTINNKYILDKIKQNILNNEYDLFKNNFKKYISKNKRADIEELLYITCLNEHKDILQYLLPFSKNISYYRPLRVLFENGNLEMIKMFEGKYWSCKNLDDLLITSIAYNKNNIIEYFIYSKCYKPKKDILKECIRYRNNKALKIFSGI